MDGEKDNNSDVDSSLKIGDQTLKILLFDDNETIPEDENLLELLKTWNLEKIYLLLRGKINT